MGPLGALQVVQEAAHPLEAGGVEGFEDVEGGEEESAGAAGGVQDGYVPHGVPEGAQELRPLALGDDVPGELLDVEVEGDEVVDIGDLSGGEPGPDFVAALAPCDDLAPCLGGEGVFVVSGLVPVAAFGHVVDAGGYVLGQVERSFKALGVVGLSGVPRNAVADGGIYVAVGVFPKQAPDAAVGPEGRPAFLACGVEEEGDDGVAGDVAGDVLLGVVGAHLLLVDVLFEDVAEDVGVDLVVLPVGPLVEVPAVAVEEVEDALEGGVGDGDVGVVTSSSS